MSSFRRLLTIVIVSTACLSGFAAYTVESVPNPKNEYSDSFVSNPDNILSSETVILLDEWAGELRHRADVELAIVAINGYDDKYYDIEYFANKLYNYWGIGDAEKSQGVLMLLDIGERAFRIEVGDGCEGVLPDVKCMEIQEQMLPFLKESDWDNAIVVGTSLLCHELTTDEAIAELLIGFKRKPVEELPFTYWYLFYSFIALLFTILLAAFGLFGGKQKANNKRYDHAYKTYRKLCFISVFFPFTVGLFSYWYRHKAMLQLRRMPFQCPDCGGDMHVLSEADEDEYLTDIQLTEENIKSIDYDVWKCDRCSHVEVMPYINHNSSISVCPQCGARTYEQLSDRIVVQPSTFSTGKGYHLYECKHCHHKVKTAFIIPKLTPPSSSSSSSSSSSYGGRSSSGGSWGGGHSSGGGSTVRF